MITDQQGESRDLRTIESTFDLVIVGGGLSGVCAAITASREGLKTALVQDRPLLGGNASSEVRLWVLGATSHMGNNNRWAREGGVINEILEENLFRNKEGNFQIFDVILLEKCRAENNLTLFLNTAAYEVNKVKPDCIDSVVAFCSQNSTRYILRAPLFCDASGDGILGFLSGAAFRMGAEAKAEFWEALAPEEANAELLGHSLYFTTKDLGMPVKFQAPSWALKDVDKIARFRQIKVDMQACHYWWIEYGGHLNTVDATEEIKWELWSVVYGMWDYIKNSGKYPEAETMTLEWVGTIPGKRESRRFEGDYMLRQQDIIEQTMFPDEVAHGGWAIDLHPVKGIYAEDPPCTQWHSKGVYGIPYRCYYSRNISNLFLAGRIISASHIAFGSTRVMATCGAGGNVVGMAAALCSEKKCNPADLANGNSLKELQARLVRAGQFLPNVEVDDAGDLCSLATASASSNYKLGKLDSDSDWLPLEFSRAMLLPLTKGNCPSFSFQIRAGQPTTVELVLSRSSKSGNFTPDVVMDSVSMEVAQGESTLSHAFGVTLEDAGYYFVIVKANADLELRVSDDRVTGILAVAATYDRKVAKSSLQDPPKGCGIESFKFWLPGRRPFGRNLALQVQPPIDAFGAENVLSGHARPHDSANAWIADPQDPEPTLSLHWQEPVSIQSIILEFDPDWDHPMESVLMGHPEEVVPFMVKDFDILDGNGNLLEEVRDHRGARCEIRLPEPLNTSGITVRIHATYGTPAAVFRIRVLPPVKNISTQKMR
ncbi:MAG: FAD-dependent oxidoreductase [Puniceicoccaceae bacterium]